MTERSDRRSFLKSIATGAMLAPTVADLSAISGRAAAAPGDSQAKLQILEPLHGAVLHGRLGRRVSDGLEIDVHGTAPPDARIFVQGRPAVRDGERFRGTAVLKHRENDIVATVGDASNGLPEARVRVLWDKQSRKRYRFAIDDNSFFLRDVTQHTYTSLFECPYLEMLRDLHKKFDACFTLNIYYTTGDDWDLRQFPDKYRSEWNENAHWLRLAFHAYANDPPRPYQDAPVEKLLADLKLVREQILRIAGPEAYSPPTVIHWGMTRPEAWKPLYQQGARVLGGYFRKTPGGTWDVNYRLDDARSEWLSRHDLLRDFPSGIIFSRIDMVVNTVPLDQIVPQLKSVVADPHCNEIVDLLTHEQYFWPFYKNYLPDHPQRMERAIEFVTSRGYKSVFLQDGFLGGPA